MEEIKIVSKDNEKIKLLKKLSQKKYRDQYSKFIVENFVIINDAILSGLLPESLFFSIDFFKKNKKLVDNLLSKSGLSCFFLIDEKINKTFSALDTPSGVCAVYTKKLKEITFDKPLVYLNSISDPGNLGNILRSALAFDFTNIVLDEHCVDLYNPKVISSAKDAILKLNVSFDKDLKILKQIKKKMKIFSTDVRGGKNITTINKKKLFCIIFGNESSGVDENIQKISDGFIRIKTSNKIESLNVASSVAIILHKFFED